MESHSVTELQASQVELQYDTLKAMESAPALLNHFPRKNGPITVSTDGVPLYFHHGRQASLPVNTIEQLPYQARHFRHSHAAIGSGRPSPSSRGHIGGSAFVLPSRHRSSKHERVPSNSTISTTSDYPGQMPASMSSTAVLIQEPHRSSSAMAGESAVHPVTMSIPNPMYMSQQCYPGTRRLSGVTADSESDAPLPSDTSLQCVPSGHSQSSSSTTALDHHLPKVIAPQKFKMPTGSSCSSTSSQEMIQMKSPGSHQYMISALPSISGEVGINKNTPAAMDDPPVIFV